MPTWLARGFPEGSTELGDARLDVQCRAQRPQRIIAMRDRCAEESHDRIADMLVHAAAILGDDRIGPSIEFLDQSAEILGIEPRRERCEAAKIGEEYSHLPALAARLRWLRRRHRLWNIGGGCFELRTQGVDGVEQPAAIPNQGHAQILEILHRQLRQYLAVDLVLAERRLVPFEA